VPALEVAVLLVAATLRLGAVVPVEPLAVVPVNATVAPVDGATVPAPPVADRPVNATAALVDVVPAVPPALVAVTPTCCATATVPALPVPLVPDSAPVSAATGVPAEPVALRPASAGAVLGAVVPADPVPAAPVRAFAVVGAVVGSRRDGANCPRLNGETPGPGELKAPTVTAAPKNALTLPTDPVPVVAVRATVTEGAAEPAEPVAAVPVNVAVPA